MIVERLSVKSILYDGVPHPYKLKIFRLCRYSQFFGKFPHRGVKVIIPYCHVACR